MSAEPSCSSGFLVSLLACKSGESAWSGEFAVPAVPCETCVSASVVPGESAVSPTVCWFFVHYIGMAAIVD